MQAAGYHRWPEIRQTGKWLGVLGAPGSSLGRPVGEMGRVVMRPQGGGFRGWLGEGLVFVARGVVAMPHDCGKCGGCWGGHRRDACATAVSWATFHAVDAVRFGRGFLHVD
jgi:hypothetical protein